MADPDVATPVQAKTAGMTNQRDCSQCGEPYAPIQATQKFCSRKCRFAYFDSYHPRVTRKRPKPTGQRKPEERDRRRVRLDAERWIMVEAMAHERGVTPLVLVRQAISEVYRHGFVNA